LSRRKGRARRGRERGSGVGVLAEEKGRRGEGAGLLPVVGDEGEILDIDDADGVCFAHVGEDDDEGVGVNGQAVEGGEIEYGVVEEGDGVVGVIEVGVSDEAGRLYIDANSWRTREIPTKLVFGFFF
jgi:hypothetical protein